MNAPMSSLDEGGVLHGVPGKLGEGLAELGDTLSLHFEVALLRHGGVPAVTDCQLEVPLQIGRDLHIVSAKDEGVDEDIAGS